MGECMTGPAGSLDWPALIGAVAVALLGEPNAALSNERELRWGRRGSLAVHVAGPYAGRFRDHEEGTGGGVLDLIQRERGGSRCEAWAWLRVQGLLTDGTVHVQARSPRGGTKHGADGRETRDKRERAHQIWKETRPLRYTLAEAHLHRRGVAVAGAPALRFHPRLRHPVESRARCPGWLLACRTPRGGFSGSSAPTCRARTRPRSSRFARVSGGSPAVRSDSPSRRTGSCSSARVSSRLRRPCSGSTLPGWAALGTPGLRALVLPEAIRTVAIAADRDAPGLEAAAALAERLEAEGRRVTICTPRAGGDFADRRDDR